jgi:uncharacterized membrane protein
MLHIINSMLIGTVLVLTLINTKRYDDLQQKVDHVYYCSVPMASSSKCGNVAPSVRLPEPGLLWLWERQ